MSDQQIQVNVDFLRQQRVHICMPCYGGQLTESTFMSFIKWSNTCRQLGIDWTIETMTNESLISRARNTLVAKFLNNPDRRWQPLRSEQSRYRLYASKTRCVCEA